MSDYATIEAAALTLIRGVSSGTVWTAANSISLANDTTYKAASLLNSGASDKYLLLMPGAFTREEMSIGLGNMLERYQVIAQIYVYVRPKSGKAPEAELAALREALINRLDAYHQLNGTTGVLYAAVVAGEPIENDTTAAPIVFITQRLVIAVEVENVNAEVD